MSRMAGRNKPCHPAFSAAQPAKKLSDDMINIRPDYEYEDPESQSSP